MFVVGLTGGIGVGKTTASNRFAVHDVPIIDTDTISRELVQPGETALDEIIRLLGEKYLTDTGTLNRSLLRKDIFTNPGLRKQLESILHPKIKEEVSRRIGIARHSYCVVVVPLLIEAGYDDLIDRIVVVECSQELRYQRILERDQIKREDIDQILGNQASDDRVLRIADDTLSNNKGLEDLHQQVDALHLRYLTLAAT